MSNLGPRVGQDPQNQDPMAHLETRVEETEQKYEQSIDNILTTLDRMQHPPHGEQLWDFYDQTAMILAPQVQILAGGDAFELKPRIISLIQTHFHGNSNEDPFQHIEYLSRIAESV